MSSETKLMKYTLYAIAILLALYFITPARADSKYTDEDVGAISIMCYVLTDHVGNGDADFWFNFGREWIDDDDAFTRSINIAMEGFDYNAPFNLVETALIGCENIKTAIQSAVEEAG